VNILPEISPSKKFFGVVFGILKEIFFDFCGYSGPFSQPRLALKTRDSGDSGIHELRL